MSLNAEISKESQGSMKERDGCGGALGGEDLGEGDPGMVVDNDVEIFPEPIRKFV